MRHNIVVIDTTEGSIHFPHLAMQVKSTATEVSVKPQAFVIGDALTIPPITTKTIKPIRVERNKNFDTIGKIHRNSQFADLPLGVNKK